VILFQYVKWKNFLSTGNFFTEVSLDKSPNTLIIGKNGSGKSTILDALTFALFGKPYRKINKPNLLNSINEKDCIVEIGFMIGSKKYKVIRGMKPNIFEIYVDGALLNQSAASKDYQEILEKNILKLNFKSFTQIVILGSASFTPFMQLSAADRRLIIEDLLDIQIFSAMNVLVKQKLVDIKNDGTNVKHGMELTAEKIKLHRQNLEENRKHNQDEITKKRNDIAESESQISKLLKNIELIQKHIDSLSSKITDKISLDKKAKKLIQLESKIETNIKKNEKDIAFYNDNDSCPTCKQELEKTFKSTQIKERKGKLKTQQNGLKEIQTEIDKANERLAEIQSINKNITQHNSEIVRLNTSLTETNKYVGKLNKEIESLSQRKTSLDNEGEKLNVLKSELNALIAKQESLSTEKHYYDFAASLLKDTGIKTKIIKQYLPIMNKLINKYLTALDSFINFNLNESFEEVIKSRHRDAFSYHNFSEGEKLRIDLAILFTWRQIAKMKNSTNTNLLILDEIFDSSLDTGGTDEFLKLMNSMGNETNLFVISHKGDQLFDKFRAVIKFDKKANFSRISK